MNNPKSIQALRLAALAATACFALVGTSSVASAGFFDQLFGAPPQPAQLAPAYDAPTQPGTPEVPTIRRQQPRRAVVRREVTPVRQKTTDLMHDKTLRPGDAVMMKDGLHIYSGPEAAKHNAKQFVPVEDARHVSPSDRATLMAMDTTGRVPPTSSASGDTLASGRSAAVSVPVSEGYRITDARGASVRYVGP